MALIDDAPAAACLDRRRRAAACAIASLDQILPQLAERDIHTQLVTSAVRPIPAEWIGLPRLQVVVSIDGLQPEHDERRTAGAPTSAS